jgi:general secretion pathway protein M
MSKTMSRIAALGLLAAIFAMALLWIVLPIMHRFQDLAQAIEDQQQQLAQYTAMASQQTSVRPLEQRRQSELALGEFLAGENDLVVQANLQTTVTGIAQANEVRIRSARRLPERERAPFKLSGLGINLTTDIENLQRFLYAIETTRPYLFIEAANFAPLGGANPAPGARPMLEVRLDIFAAAHRRDQ